jgi:hypothetical protein
MCCLDWIDRVPPGGAAGYPQPGDQSPSCCSIARTALSVAAVALSVFSTVFFLGTGKLIALGCAVALGLIGVLFLARHQNDGWAHGEVLRTVRVFQQAVPSVALSMPATAPPPRPMVVVERAPPPMVVSYVPAETRIHVGDSTPVARAPMFPGYARGVGRSMSGEDRVQVRDGGRVALASVPVPPPAFVSPSPAPFVAPTYGDERVPVRNHGSALPHPFVPPTPYVRPQAPAPAMGPDGGEARVQVRDRGRVGPQQPDDEQRVPVGRH